MKTVLISYKSGNIRSVLYALERLGCEAILSDDPEIISSADKLIFPGVGEASSAMARLKEKKLDELIPRLKQPVLGICLGMQLMCRHSEEGDTAGMGIFPAEVRKFRPAGSGEKLKVPHMGWNSVHDLRNPLFSGIGEEACFYFVHSYCADICENTCAVTDYIVPFSASLCRDNFYGVQFHPEKSGLTGEKLIRNFLDL